ncbi:hypothetical protein BV902_25360 [Sphingobacterium sp. B29]|uniref:carboxypeptidase-like regulatory domain-containing protein n=1 Tax=Sphingobacterium sp. B29 TaxID=1933220 RepID=UPI00095844C0|nr:carboxypeptidase-like regulatory domain-containing protein [Sphingobacterium sp. B29]APU99238.1 hypothetical protein BV902_25360 [Sphingobacterium sp. B29]
MAIFLPFLPVVAFRLAADPNGVLVFIKTGFAIKEVYVNIQKLIAVSLSAGAATAVTDSTVQNKDSTATVVAGRDSITNAAAGRDSTTKIVANQDSTIKVTDSPNSSGGVSAGKTSVTGTVTGPKGPLPGVTVAVVGTNVSASTDEAGKFQIAAGPKNQLRFSSLGFEAITQLVGDRKDIQVVLSGETKVLDSV